VCTSELRTLRPGDTATFTFRLGSGVPGGQYRVSTDIERMESGARGAIVSNTFAATAPAA
jgi:hypothetical protein